MIIPPLFRTSEIRAIEQAHGTAGLMEKAGLAVATLAKELLSDEAYSILIIAGPGNNGGDAFVAARYLKSWWLRVDVFFTGDPDRMPPDAAAAYRAWLDAGGELLSALPEKTYDLVIDGLFGIGLAKVLHGHYAELVRQINAMDAPVLAIDVPSGLCANTGRVLGEAVIADHTLTFLGLKPGLFTLDGVDFAGTVHSSDLGGDTGAVAHPQGWLLNEIPILPSPRLRNSHKGNNGSIGVLGGDTAMVGAALLAARAALLIGAGRVYAGLLTEKTPAVDPVQPELMLRDGNSLLDLNHLTALIAGPGLGRSALAEGALHRALRYPAHLVLDADALVLLAANAELRQTLAAREHPTLLTPHPGEAAALLAGSVADVQADRIASALDLAVKYRATVLLKGAGTVIAMPDGQWFINASGNPGLAAAGMGDTLAGIIGGLAAQGMELDQAAMLGTYLHGAAADTLVAEGIGPLGLTASEVALAARKLINLWITQEYE
ncbi:MAG: NAD(P)H-hydrate dehydratase [Methylophilaceae bacterium]